MGEGVVRIEARRDGDSLAITVRDNGPGVVSHREGVGLGNTRARLEQLYGNRGSVMLNNAEGGGAVAEIVVPLHR
jgi:sensor histidine kinase YesM